MSKTKRKRYTGAFKAKVGLDALIGLKTVGQIAREYLIGSADPVNARHLPAMKRSCWSATGTPRQNNEGNANAI